MTAAARPRFLLGCFEAPGWGGASTVTYALFEAMQRDGIAAHYVNLVAARDAAMFRDAFGPAYGNPRALDAVETCVLPDPLWRAHDALAARIAALRPDLLVARGYVATWLLRQAAPHLPLVFLTSGCNQVKRLIADGAIADFADFARLAARGVTFNAPLADRERAAVVGSDLIILHSPLVRAAFEQFFPGHLGKVYANLISVADQAYGEAQPFAALARPFAERDIDVVFVASDWRRAEKNYPLVGRLARACADLRVHLVGAAPADDLPLRRHGVVAARAELFALLGRARVVVSPSRFDAAPGVLFEGSAMGCNVVTWPNCGNWELCDERLLARTAADFPACIRRAVAAPLPDRRQRFLGGYGELVETLHAFV